MNTSLDFTSIIALVSVTLGWFLSSISNWVRRTREDRKIMKQVLFNLLETLHALKRLDISTEMAPILEKVNSFISEEEKEQFYKIASLLPQNIEEVIYENVSSDLKKIDLTYSKAIDELSKIDPINAYRLNGRTMFAETFNKFKEWFLKFVQTVDAPSADQGVLSSIVQIVRPEILNDAVNAIEEDIRSIAFSIGIFTWIKTRKTLRRQNTASKNGGDKKIFSIFENIHVTTSNSNRSM